jgi:hypothetical protein
MSISYDPDLLQEFVDDLYRRAKRMAQWTALKYGLAAAALFGAGTWLIENLQLSHVTNAVQYSRLAADAQSTALFVGIIAGAVGALLGYSMGAEKGFKLRLEAQQLLLQMEIEQNTREVGKNDKAAVAANSSVET